MPDPQQDQQYRIVRTPDGTTHRFPATATDDQISTALGQGQIVSPKTIADAIAQSDAILQAEIGVAKGAGKTAIGLAQLVHKIPGISDLMNFVPFLTDEALASGRHAMEPTNTAQGIGQFGEQTGEFFLPTGLAGKVGKLAEIGKNVALTQAQTDNPKAAGLAGVLSAVMPAASHTVAPKLERSANESFVRAMGPAGGRGPTKAADLIAAQEMAPQIVKTGAIRPTSAASARALGADAVKETSDNLKHVLNMVGTNRADQPKLLQAIQAQRRALRTPGAGATSFVSSGAEATDALWAELEKDVQQVQPTAEGLHELKRVWNEVANFAAADPAAGSKRAVYEAGGNLIRAQLANDHQAISKADKFFSIAKKFDDIVNAPTTLRPGGGVAELISPFARPAAGAVVGGAEGYRQGGVTGAVAGAVGGAALVRLIQSPGFRYVSAAMKQTLANALKSGDEQRISNLITAISAQAAKLGQGR